METNTVGKVVSIAVRTAQRGPMMEVAEAHASVDAGLHGDIAVAVNRGVTLLSAAQWRQVNAELKADLPWHTRRANVLIDAPALGPLIGKTVRVGEVILEITGETRPCALMDALHQGLRQALVPDCRGGVTARVVQGGVIRRGDVMAKS